MSDKSMVDKYRYVFDPSDTGDPLHEKVCRTLDYSDMESGELESIRTQLRNTQTVLGNLIVLMADKGLLKRKDWDALIGRNETEDDNEN